VRALVADLLVGRSAATVSARFHNTLAAAAAAAVARALRLTGPVPVVLTGGVFQNARLAETVTRLVEPRAPVWRHRMVPPGDGGIALGQAVIANALIASGADVASEGACV
jgi:hydrogenase maturation protein HypF